MAPLLIMCTHLLWPCLGVTASVSPTLTVYPHKALCVKLPPHSGSAVRCRRFPKASPNDSFVYHDDPVTLTYVYQRALIRCRRFTTPDDMLELGLGMLLQPCYTFRLPALTFLQMM